MNSGLLDQPHWNKLASLNLRFQCYKRKVLRTQDQKLNQIIADL